jgi:transcriptional regulator with XRE-family HTH domain
MGKQRLALSEQIRGAVNASGLSRYRICKRLGMAESTLSRFMSGQGGLSMEYLDRMAELLDLRIEVGEGRRKKG